MVGLEPCADNASFVCATEAGYVYRFQLLEPDLNIEVRPLGLDAAGLGSQFFEVRLEDLAKLYQDITDLRVGIYHTKVRTQQRKEQLQQDFEKDMSLLVNQTMEVGNQAQSEQTRLKTEHENKSILLRRQIANNVKLFEKSKEALAN